MLWALEQLKEMGLRRQLVYPGWNRRTRRGWEPLAAWQLVLHRLLWGFDRLMHVTPEDAWIELRSNA